MITMTNVEYFAKEECDVETFTELRRDLLVLIKVIRKIQQQSLQRTESISLQNYLKLVNVVDFGEKKSLALNVISCIQKFDELAMYYKDDNILMDIKDIKLVQDILLNEITDIDFDNLRKHPSNKIHLSNEFQLHPYSIEQYYLIPDNAIIVQKFDKKYKDKVLNNYWNNLSEEDKKQYHLENWKEYMYDKTQQTIKDARKHFLDSYVTKIKELQEQIIDQHIAVRRKYSLHLSMRINKDKVIDESTKYGDLCTELRLLLDHIINRAVTHVADSIVGVTKLSPNRYGCLIDARKINLMGIKKGFFIQKVTDWEFIKDNFRPEYIEEINAGYKEDGICTNWICCQKNPMGSGNKLALTTLKDNLR
jgi:hypothetical protein